MSKVVKHKPVGIYLSSSAKQHILNYLMRHSMKKGVRFSVKKTGCSGFSYVIDYVDAAIEQDIVQVLDEHFILCIDKESYPLLHGMEVDYVQQGLNHKFSFSNPNQKGQCGCGESFTV